MGLGVTYTTGMDLFQNNLLIYYLLFIISSALFADHASILQYTEKENDSARDLRCT
jgi:hypothetical protein